MLRKIERLLEWRLLCLCLALSRSILCQWALKNKQIKFKREFLKFGIQAYSWSSFHAAEHATSNAHLLIDGLALE
jgi:hypothetical protein